MRAVNIPIRSLMPQPDDAVEYMPMPREMATFEMPRLPQAGPGNDVAGARDVLDCFVGHFDAWLAGGDLPALELLGLTPDTLRVLNETLGEGEVSAIVDAGHEVRLQETVFSGVWREQHFHATGALLHDYLLAAPMPPIVEALARERAAPRLRALELPVGAMNVPALVNELQDAMDRSGPESPSHVINLTLLPLSPEDTSHIDAVLDGGSVVILSRGFGNCRISATHARGIWRVRYFNTMNTVILDTIEVVDLPEAARAAGDDYDDSVTRLVELLAWLREG
jgi:hydrogenase-1 operon protein HyaF